MVINEYMDIDWKFEARLLHLVPDETGLTHLGKEARRSFDIYKDFYNFMESICNKQLFNTTDPETIRLNRECIQIAKQDLDDKYQRLTTLRMYYVQLLDGMRTSRGDQSFRLTFGS